MNKNFDPWTATNYSTAQLRDVAQSLRDRLPKIDIEPDQRTPDHWALIEGIKAVCMAADYIDRLHQQADPVIVNVSVHATAKSFDLYGVDSVGRVWQYQLTDDPKYTGWLPMPAGRVEPFNANVVPLNPVDN